MSCKSKQEPDEDLAAKPEKPKGSEDERGVKQEELPESDSKITTEGRGIPVSNHLF